MEIEKFTKILNKVAAACQVNMTPEQIAVYYEDLGHLTDDQLEKAARDCRQKEESYGKMFSIATILKYAEPDHLASPCLDNPAFDKRASEDISGLLFFLKGRSKTGCNPEIGTLYYPPKQVNNNELLTKLVSTCFGSWQEFCANHQNEWDGKRLRETIMTYLKDPFYRAEAEKILGGKGGWLKSQVLPALTA